MPIDIERVKQELGYLTVAEHTGDVNNALPDLCKALGLPEPRWCDEYEHFVMAWDEEQHIKDVDSEDHTCDIVNQPVKQAGEQR